jgi:hypothetical protein
MVAKYNPLASKEAPRGELLAELLTTVHSAKSIGAIVQSAPRRIMLLVWYTLPSPDRRKRALRALERTVCGPRAPKQAYHIDSPSLIGADLTLVQAQACPLAWLWNNM